MNESISRPATYQDVLDAPEHMVAEIVDGILYTHPRPAMRHAKAASRLGILLGNPFDLGIGGPGGWILYDEPELHMGADILVPDLAGWRGREPADGPYTTLVPDWICEVLSPSTQALDRGRKLDIYRREGISHAWLIDPARQRLEVYRRAPVDAPDAASEDERQSPDARPDAWVEIAVHEGAVSVRAEPFDALALDLALLW
jgi:Uma2 family endonuclease